MMISHEVLGHGLATLAFGAHITQVTSVAESWRGDVSAAAARAIAGAGIAGNFFYGALALAALRWTRALPGGLRFFLWFFGHATIFMGSGYLLSSALFGFGDVPQVLHGLPFEIGWRIAAIASGFAIYRFALEDAARSLSGWAGDSLRMKRARTFSLIPYLAMGIVTTTAGLLNPQGPLNGIAWSAAATFGAGAGFSFLTLMIGKTATASDPLDLRRSPGWIAAGAIATLVMFGALGPGVPRSS